MNVETKLRASSADASSNFDQACENLGQEIVAEANNDPVSDRILALATDLQSALNGSKPVGTD